ncbi:histidine phosphatase family protein [Acidocella aminolytica]|jgi:broad specificity phosphatase PhoE|uniref:histidine phosphatase family protein n=1 Tax=Acidocella aminolytica TaxID=33998 RepID=UPI0006626254|nr:histidine phosphatase family protein [Acidocella aminolytica]SHF05937.1 alpha-ribazole phosphatase [Acidocella aminolytica 101 = DSM 11237]
MSCLLLIRHASSAAQGRLAGRLDVPAEPLAPEQLAAARQRLALFCPGPARLLTSPLQRCRQTAQALFPTRPADADPRLREQDFGAWEGQQAESLPDLGPLSRVALAAHCPPGGESFLALTARAAPALQEIATHGPAILITHAGVIRAALGLALGVPASALGFEIAPLSATRVTLLPGGQWSIGFTNLALAAP